MTIRHLVQSPSAKQTWIRIDKTPYSPHHIFHIPPRHRYILLLPFIRLWKYIQNNPVPPLVPHEILDFPVFKWYGVERGVFVSSESGLSEYVVDGGCKIMVTWLVVREVQEKGCIGDVICVGVGRWVGRETRTQGYVVR